MLAVQVLHADARQMGVLVALESLALLLIGLPAGAWVDRWRKKRVLVAGDLTRALLLACLPVAAALGRLTLWQLYAVTTAAGVATVFFDVAYQSYLPALVPGEQVVEGNSRLEATRAVAQVGGPAIGGALIGVVSAVVLTGLDAVSYLLSALFVARIRHPETPPPRSQRRPLRTEIGEGLAFVLGHRLLRRIVACTSGSNFFNSMTMALLTLYVLRVLGLEAAVLGFVLATSAVGGLLGALATSRIVARVGGAGRSSCPRWPAFRARPPRRWPPRSPRCSAPSSCSWPAGSPCGSPSSCTTSPS